MIDSYFKISSKLDRKCINSKDRIYNSYGSLAHYVSNNVYPYDYEFLLEDIEKLLEAQIISKLRADYGTS